MDALTKHFSPPPSSIVQCFRVHTRVRLYTESIADYVAALRQLLEFCEFGETVDNIIRDRLACRIQRLLAEPTLDFAKALQIALAMDRADKNSQQLSGVTSLQQVYYGSNSKFVSKPQLVQWS